MIDEDFAKSQEQLEISVSELKKMMREAIEKKEEMLEREYQIHVNRMTNEIADNIKILTDER